MTGRKATRPELFNECPHGRPCWCRECRNAYQRAYAKTFNRRERYGPQAEWDDRCPHAWPCWCCECRRNWNSARHFDYVQTEAGKAANRSAFQRYRQTEHGSQALAARSDARRNVHNPEPISIGALGNRDGWRCHLCGMKVDARRKHPDPMSASRDHIIPVSLGGDGSRANQALAHLRCNLSKGNRPVGEQLRLIG